MIYIDILMIFYILLLNTYFWKYYIHFEKTNIYIYYIIY